MRVKCPLIGEPERHPVRLLPEAEAAVVLPVAPLVPVALLSVPPGTFWLGAAGDV